MKTRTARSSYFHRAEAGAGGQSGTRVQTTRTYEITVRLADGSSRIFNDTSPARWRLGERVIIIDGANRSNP